MCGLAGRAGRDDGWLSASVLAALEHRGPDASSHVEAEVGGWWCALAHTRLAINDLTAAADQPLYNEDESIAIVFNGEIYNSPELRRLCEARGHTLRSRSDGEVIAHLWEDEGLEGIRRLNGIFAIAIHDRRSGEVVLARDPLGVKPLFWSSQGTTLWFASELRALEAAGAPVGPPDVTAMAQFLTFLWVPDPRTPFTNAHSLRPGTALRWAAGNTALVKYSDPVLESADEETLPLDLARREFPDRFQEAVRRQLLSDVPIALMASGGIDSSLLWWAAGSKLSRAYTIEWKQERGGERLHEDTDAVRTLEASLGTPVTYVKGDSVAVDELLPSGDLFADPAVQLCRQIAGAANADGHKVLLSGQGGDELLGGYRRHLLGPLAARLPTGPVGRAASSAFTRFRSGVAAEYASRLALASSKTDHLSSYMVLCSYSEANDRACVLGVTTTEVSDDVVFESHRDTFEKLPRSWSLLRRFRALDLKVYMPGLGLAYADRSGMHESVEVRVPWLDLDLVRWAMRLPDRALVSGGKGKVLSRSLAADVLPAVIASRPKRGFAAPARMLPASAGAARGFRQGRYFQSAVGLVEERLGRAGTLLPEGLRR